jgi:SAM-dependent methyltransferase
LEVETVEGTREVRQKWKSDPELSYFDLHAYVGTTKHMGGLSTTQELIALCHVSEDTYVLDVGCGVGATTCYLAKAYGCHAVGVDLRESMIARSNERAEKEGVTDQVEFKVADAQDLPFEDGTFDVVLCESVATFIEDKQQVARELARVVKPGGYVGLNEEIWLKPAPPQLDAFVKRTWDIDPEIPTSDDWLGWLKNAGLKDIVMNIYSFDARRESTQVKRYRIGDTWRMLYRTLVLYVRNPAFRAYMKGRRKLPKHVFEYFGHALFVGRR